MDLTELNSLHGIELARLAMWEIQQSQDEPPPPTESGYASWGTPGSQTPAPSKAPDTPFCYRWSMDLFSKVKATYRKHQKDYGLPQMTDMNFHGITYVDGKEIQFPKGGWNTDGEDCLRVALYVWRLMIAVRDASLKLAQPDRRKRQRRR